LLITHGSVATAGARIYETVLLKINISSSILQLSSQVPLTLLLLIAYVTYLIAACKGSLVMFLLLLSRTESAHKAHCNVTVTAEALLAADI
jgi:hypothetical protein